MKGNPMPMYMLSESHFQKLSEDIEQIKESLFKSNEGNLTDTYIDSKSVPKLLKISQKTWQSYRDKGIIPFIQIGSKIWVKRIDLDNFMSSYYIKKSSK